jgi:archaemetzincin
MKSSGRVSVLALMVAAVFAFWWFRTPPPKVGGGQNDDLLAPWVKGRIYAAVSPPDEAGFTRLTTENANGWYNVSREPIQSFDYYRSLKPLRPTKERRTIVLQPIGPFDARQTRLLGDLKEFCAAFFQLPVRLEKPLPLPVSDVKTRTLSLGKHGASQKQYNAEEMLEKTLVSRFPNDATAYLGITMVDLWASNLSFVFGLGSSERRTGVYSLTRYFPGSNEKMTPAQWRIGLRRSCQILDHEMGHMLGLYHCVLYKCSMNGCNSLMDADASPMDYCPVCHQKLLWNVGMNGTKRYEDLLRYYRKYGLAREANWTEQRLRNWRAIKTSM